jgi:hypothetical protein
LKTLILSLGQKETSVKQSTVLEKLKELDAQRDQLMSDAKKDALTRAEEAVSELNALGFHYYLGEGEARPMPTRRFKQPVATKSAQHVPKDAPCPICNFRTDRPHDRRSHRMQKRKRPFNDKELETMGMTRL